MRGTNDANLVASWLAEISRRRRPRARRRARRTAASTIARVRRRARHHGSRTAAAPSRRSGDGPSAAPWPLRAALAVPRTKVGTSFSEVLAAYVQYDTYFLSLKLKSHTVGPCNTRPAANIPSRNFRSRRRRRAVSRRARSAAIRPGATAQSAMRRDGGGAKDPGAASPPPMGPFVLPKDRPPRAKSTKSSDGSASAGASARVHRRHIQPHGWRGGGRDRGTARGGFFC